MRTSERWSRIEALYHAARERDAAARASFLDAACADDEELRREVESLLAQTVSGDGFLSGTALVAAAAVVRERDGRLTGRRMGSYQIQELLGAGGMGEVYRAIDTRLMREVAIKCLPPLFAEDRERLARFDREARILAALNHPHIGAIYGLEESAGLRGLVLELVEGETLADRIRRGPLPIGEALVFARQLADALEAAHDRGIVHRDLKPANISQEGEIPEKPRKAAAIVGVRSLLDPIGPNVSSRTTTISKAGIASI